MLYCDHGKALCPFGALCDALMEPTAKSQTHIPNKREAEHPVPHHQRRMFMVHGQGNHCPNITRNKQVNNVHKMGYNNELSGLGFFTFRNVPALRSPELKA